MANKKAKYSDWDYKSSYKSRPQIRISDRAYKVLSKGKGSMAEQVDRLLGLSSEKLAVDFAPVDVSINLAPVDVPINLAPIFPEIPASISATLELVFEGNKQHFLVQNQLPKLLGD